VSKPEELVPVDTVVYYHNWPFPKFMIVKHAYTNPAGYKLYDLQGFDGTIVRTLRENFTIAPVPVDVAPKPKSDQLRPGVYRLRLPKVERATYKGNPKHVVVRGVPDKHAGRQHTVAYWEQWHDFPTGGVAGGSWDIASTISNSTADAKRDRLVWLHG
jgi:hypothetical protein